MNRHWENVFGYIDDIGDDFKRVVIGMPVGRGDIRVTRVYDPEVIETANFDMFAFILDDMVALLDEALAARDEVRPHI